MKFYKYQGAGNDFLIVDNRSGSISLTKKEISRLCDRHYGVGADGLMLLESSDRYGFRMVYFNSDGSGGMMCGNGGRCIAAFASDLGLESLVFEAPDGLHEAEILENAGREKKIRLKMKNVSVFVQESEDSWFIDTGTRHSVRFVTGIEKFDVAGEGKKTRYSERYAPEGANANFAEVIRGDSGTLLHVRTYEKGVENETFACGTGITACAIAASLTYPEAFPADGDGRIRADVQALRDRLGVDFIRRENSFTDVWLTGPAVKVAEIEAGSAGDDTDYEKNL